MIVPRSVISALVIADVGLSGIVVHGMLKDYTRPALAGTKRPAESGDVVVGNRRLVADAAASGREPRSTPVSVPAIDIVLNGDSVSLTVNTATAVQIHVDRHTSSQATRTERPTGEPPSTPASPLAIDRTRSVETTLTAASDALGPIHRRFASRTRPDTVQSMRSDAPPEKGRTLVVAQDGAIVLVGAGGHMTANTGASSASGTVAVGVRGSALQTGTSGMPVNAGQARPPRSPDAPPLLVLNRTAALADATSTRGVAEAAGDSTLAYRIASALAKATHLRRRLLSPRDTANGRPFPLKPDSLSHGNASLPSAIRAISAARDMGIAISGFEDHSVSALGNDQVLTYDDSNVFIDRDGPINANTGDTDSSGLNAVDVRGSRVRSGNSGDAESAGDDESDDEKKSGGDKESMSPDSTGRARVQQVRWAKSVKRKTARRIVRSTNTSDDNAPESPNAGMRYPDLKKNQSFATVTDEGASAAIGKTTMVVGADGFDDVSIRSAGDGNIVTYDDSNLIIGGTGKVNAQIGDSDTGGAVVMGIVGSDVQAGCEGDLCHREPREPMMASGRAQLAPKDSSRARPAPPRLARPKRSATPSTRPRRNCSGKTCSAGAVRDSLPAKRDRSLSAAQR